MLRVAASPKRTTSTGKRKPAEHVDLLGGIGDDDHALGRDGDDLLAQQRAAAALDQAQLAVELVGAVDGEIEERRVVERGERDAERARPAAASPPRSART